MYFVKHNYLILY